MASVFDVAQYILERKGEMTTWKLQKLVYYAQAWSLVWDDEPLFAEEIEAWANGPVCPALYQLHRGRLKISSLSQGSSENLTRDELETIDVVIKHYGEKSAQYLSELSHQEAPWQDARGDLPPGVRGNHVIPLASMAEYYGGL